MTTDGIGRALGRIPSGIFVCACGRGTDAHPFVASWVMQASFDPPAITISVEEDRAAIQALEAAGGGFTLSILPDKRHDLMKPFFAKASATPFGDLATTATESGGIFLTDGLAWLDCVKVTECQVGKHRIIVAKVIDGEVLQEGSHPLVHVRKHGFSY